jgi:hypothetical protein
VTHPRFAIHCSSATLRHLQWKEPPRGRERPLVSLTSHESSTWQATEWIKGRRALERWSPCGGSTLFVRVLSAAQPSYSCRFSRREAPSPDRRRRRCRGQLRPPRCPRRQSPPDTPTPSHCSTNNRSRRRHDWCRSCRLRSPRVAISEEVRLFALSTTSTSCHRRLTSTHSCGHIFERVNPSTKRGPVRHQTPIPLTTLV